MRYKEVLQERKSSFEVLEKNKMPLSEEERDAVMKAGAVWNHGPNGAPSPAVWKAKDSSGNVKYVCNTHRMYQVRDTLEAAIKAYDIVEQSA